MAKTIENDFLDNFNGYVPIVTLFLIGLIKTESITYHQKVFKTLLIIIGVCFCAGYYFYTQKNKKHIPIEKISIYFALYFGMFFLQYIISFMSGEISYDGNYYIANYFFLIALAFFTFLIIRSESDIKKVFLAIPIFLFFLSFSAGYDFYTYYSFPSRITSTVISEMSANKENHQAIISLQTVYAEENGDFVLKKSKMSSTDKKNTKYLLKKSGYYKTVPYFKVLTQYRPALTFGNTNYLAGYLITLIPLSILGGFALYDRKKKIRENYISIICLVGSLAGIFPLLLTQTTSAFMGLYVTVVCLLIPSLIITNQKLTTKTKFILITLDILILFITPIILLINAKDIFMTFAPRLVSKTQAPLFVLYDRINGWTPAWNLFKRHPITGAGLGTMYAASFQYISKYYYIYSASNSFKHSHNEFIELLGEGGILGFAFFIALVAFITIKLTKIFISHENSKVLRYSALGTVAGIFAVFIQQVFDLSMRMSVTQAAYFLVIGIGISIILLGDKTKSKLSESFLIPKNLIIIITISLITIFGFLYRPLFMAENSIMKSFFDYKNKEEHLDNSIKYMPGNPYAWSIRFDYHFSAVKQLINKYTQENETNEQLKNQIDFYYNKAIEDLLTVNSIIPGYQDVWGKRSRLLIEYNNLLGVLYSQTKDPSISDLMVQNLQLTLSDVDKSLASNFLNSQNHLIRIYLINKLGVTDYNYQALKDAIESNIYVSYSKYKRLTKNKVNIYYESDKTGVIAGENFFDFFATEDHIKRYSDMLPQSSDNLQDINKLISDATNPILSPLIID